MHITLHLPDPVFLAGIVIAPGAKIAPVPPDLAHQLDELVARRATEEFPPPALKEAIRQMLRRGGFKPSSMR